MGDLLREAASSGRADGGSGGRRIRVGARR